jgi:hypothetical protein
VPGESRKAQHVRIAILESIHDDFHAPIGSAQSAQSPTSLHCISGDGSYGIPLGILTQNELRHVETNISRFFAGCTQIFAAKVLVPHANSRLTAH